MSQKSEAASPERSRSSRLKKKPQRYSDNSMIDKTPRKRGKNSKSLPEVEKPPDILQVAREMQQNQYYAKLRTGNKWVKLGELGFHTEPVEEDELDEELGLASEESEPEDKLEHSEAEQLRLVEISQNTYINCDLRYFNLSSLVEKVGDFDVVMLDPPWRLKGGQRNSESQLMFSNNRFSLNYDTLSNQEIMNIKVESLSRKGFCFLWILNSQMKIGYEMLNHWGYEVVDQIVWVKTKNEKVYVSHGWYFLHSTESCLVGYKCPPREQLEYKSRVSNNLIFSDVRKKSQKPEEIYEIIDQMLPGGKKIELFARNNNLRPGWFSLGNQLGQLYDGWVNVLDCDECGEKIMFGVHRYKSRREANYDLCEDCFNKKKDESKKPETFEDEFYVFDNLIEDEVIHDYHKCNSCKSEPIWGPRFRCKQCEDFDLCEACHDELLKNPTKAQTISKVHVPDHDFQLYEAPVMGSGMPVHRDTRCRECLQKPILGPCFTCADCPNLNLCQKCFFSYTPQNYKAVKGHKTHHRMELIAEPQGHATKYIKCNGCSKDIRGLRYKCNHCFNFDFCTTCYIDKANFNYSELSSHKPFHSFSAFTHLV